MKANIHPNWNANTVVSCACGNSFITGSTMEQIKVEICSKCHPFFTGQQRFVDTLGQVERFQKKTKESAEKGKARAAVMAARAAKKQDNKSDKPSLKDLLIQARKNLNS